MGKILRLKINKIKLVKFEYYRFYETSHNPPRMPPTSYRPRLLAIGHPDRKISVRIGHFTSGRCKNMKSVRFGDIARRSFFNVDRSIENGFIRSSGRLKKKTARTAGVLPKNTKIPARRVGSDRFFGKTASQSMNPSLSTVEARETLVL